MVGTFSHYDQFLPARAIKKAEAPSELRRAEQDLAATYTYDGRRRTLPDYLDRNPVTGFLIASLYRRQRSRSYQSPWLAPAERVAHTSYRLVEVSPGHRFQSGWNWLRRR
jgi:hypothetical protein